jgi:hypothetical protein
MHAMHLITAFNNVVPHYVLFQIPPFRYPQFLPHLQKMISVQFIQVFDFSYARALSGPLCQDNNESSLRGVTVQPIAAGKICFFFLEPNFILHPRALPSGQEIDRVQNGCLGNVLLRPEVEFPDAFGNLGR